MSSPVLLVAAFVSLDPNQTARSGNSDPVLQCLNEVRVTNPQALEQAVELLLECTGSEERQRILAEREAAFTLRTHMAIGFIMRNQWLRTADSGLRRELIGLGFKSPDDMSSAVLSAVWHQVHNEPFDIQSRADCARAWNRESQRLIHDWYADTWRTVQLRRYRTHRGRSTSVATEVSSPDGRPDPRVKPTADRCETIPVFGRRGLRASRQAHRKCNCRVLGSERRCVGQC
jgi:uncharacterized protein DUF6794